jgi:hypothetical protein
MVGPGVFTRELMYIQSKHWRSGESVSLQTDVSVDVASDGFNPLLRISVELTQSRDNIFGLYESRGDGLGQLLSAGLNGIAFS